MFRRFSLPTISLVFLLFSLAVSSAYGASGDLIWSFKTNGAIWGNIKVTGNTIYFGSDDGHLYALNAQTRTLQWKFATRDRIRATPAFAGQGVFFSSDDGYIYALHKDSGELLWKYNLGDGEAVRNLPAYEATSDFDWGKSSPVVKGHSLYVGSADGHLYALNATSGDLLWKFKAKDRIRSNPVAQGNRVYFGSWDHSVYALDGRTGELLWKQKTGGRIVSTPLLMDGRVIVGSRDAQLYAWNAKSGETEWVYRYPNGSWVESSGIAGDEGTFFLGSSDARKVSKFNTATGEEAWSFPIDGWGWATPTLANGILYIGTTGADEYWQQIKRSFYAVDVQTGQLRWSYEPKPVTGYVHGGVHSSPAVKGARVYVGDLDGHLYVFEE